MRRAEKTVAFGPVAHIEANVIHLSPIYQVEKQNESDALVGLADQTRAIGELVSRLGAEIASLKTTGRLSP
jgi:hypothetical protein